MEGDKNKSRLGIVVVVIIVVAVVAATAWFLATQEEREMRKEPEPEVGPTIVPGITGIQGEVAFVNYGELWLTLYQQQKLVQLENGEFSLKGSVYTVFWDDETKFQTYADAPAVQADIRMAATIMNLEMHKNAIVVPRRVTPEGIIAREILILPGSTITGAE